VVIRVEDSGVGIPEDTQQQLFEPFFTTKPLGQGTGLGLPVVKNIIEQHDGFIDVDSSPGQGSTFNIYLPFKIRPPIAATRRHPPIEDLSGDEHLMVIDTSEKTRELVRLMLTSVGYHIFDATSPEDALIVYRDCWQVAKMVLMDVTLPEQGAEVLMYQLMAINPDVKILFTSAYGPTAEITRFVVDGGMYFVPRPYTADMLRRMVRTVLDNPVINPGTYLKSPMEDTH
ncbi:MAG: ATP-binding protein, partial [Pseudomonadota bacterium]